ncbi:MAG: transcriptional repressor [Bacteroidota bacterium]
MENKTEINQNKLKIVKKVFSDYLAAHGHKQTAVRMAILEEMYNLDNHFDVDQLHHYLRSKNYKVSMATIYNNIKLYENAGLITKHRFGNGMAQYEKCYFRGNHDHIILTDSGEVMEFRDDRIDKIKETIEETFGIKVDRHSLYFYGRCCEQEEINKVGESKPLNDTK